MGCADEAARISALLSAPKPVNLSAFIFSKYYLTFSLVTAGKLSVPSTSYGEIHPPDLFQTQNRTFLPFFFCFLHQNIRFYHLHTEMHLYQTVFFFASTALKCLRIFPYWPLIFPLASLPSLLHTSARINCVSFSPPR